MGGGGGGKANENGGGGTENFTLDFNCRLLKKACKVDHLYWRDVLAKAISLGMFSFTLKRSRLRNVCF